MKKVIDFKSSEEHYNADACIVWCFDNRFDKLLKEMKKEFRLNYTDDVEVAGGAMGLSGRGSGANNSEINYIADQVEKSIRLHKTPVIILMLHRDCGAYKAIGLPARGEDEIYLLSADLRSARENLNTYLKDKGHKPEVKLYIADFDGLWEVK